MKKEEIKFRLAELFSGPGGLALGAMRSERNTGAETTANGFLNRRILEPIWRAMIPFSRKCADVRRSFEPMLRSYVHLI
jgi:hypothetical protein